MRLAYPFIIGALVCLILASSFKIENDEVPYPEGYRMWTHIKSGMVGPKSKSYNVLGGFYHVYANPLAMRDLSQALIRWIYLCI